VKILIFSDIHGDMRALERIVAQPAEVYICAGDLATFGKGLQRCAEVLKPLGERLWVIPGNHESHDSTRGICWQYGFVDFHRQKRVLPSRNGDTHWAGLGYSNITPFNTPGEYSEEELATALADFEALKPLYLVAHVPPRDSKLDEFSPGKHAGSCAVAEWIRRVQPLYAFCGHIHETAGMHEKLGATECINVGKQGFLLEI